MSEVAVARIDQATARRLTDEIKATVMSAADRLLAFYEDGGHLALGYTSWGAYYEAEFQQSGRRGYQLLEGARVVKELEAVNNCSLPANEAQARELARVEPERRADVWREASENGAPTAARIRELASEPVQLAPSTRVLGGQAPNAMPPVDWTVGTKALVRIAEGLAWVRHAGGPAALVEAAVQHSGMDEFIFESWVDDIERFTIALQEWRQSIPNPERRLRRVK